jgi:hypothetical protein
MESYDINLNHFRSNLTEKNIIISSNYLIYYYCSYFKDLKLVPVTLTEKVVYRHLHCDIISYKFNTTSVAHIKTIDYNIFSNTSLNSKWCVFYEI